MYEGASRYSITFLKPPKAKGFWKFVLDIPKKTRKGGTSVLVRKPRAIYTMCKSIHSPRCVIVCNLSIATALLMCAIVTNWQSLDVLSFTFGSPSRAPMSTTSGIRPNRYLVRSFTSTVPLVFHSSNDDESWDSSDDYQDFNEAIEGAENTAEGISLDEDSDVDYTTLPQKVAVALPVDITFTPQDVQSIKEEATNAINEIFAERVADLEDIKRKTREDFERSKAAMGEAQKLEAERVSNEYGDLIDVKINKLLEDTREQRESILMKSKASRDSMGKGFEVGSWGVDEFGREVLISSSVGDTNTGGGLSASDAQSDLNQAVGLQLEMGGNVLIICDESRCSKEELELAKSLVKTLPDTSANESSTNASTITASILTMSSYQNQTLTPKLLRMETY